MDKLGREDSRDDEEKGNGACAREFPGDRVVDYIISSDRNNDVQTE